MSPFVVDWDEDAALELVGSIELPSHEGEQLAETIDRIVYDDGQAEDLDMFA